MSGGPRTSACISALNEERTIAAVLWQAALSGAVDDIIVVVNGATDRTAEVARGVLPPGRPVVRIVDLPDRLGHDVGRALAATMALEAGSDILVFLDGDFPVPAADIGPFRKAVEGGADVALNRLTPLLPDPSCLGPVAWVRLALNVFLGRPDLGLEGLTVVPHALSRRAVETIGPETLAVPPLAHARAVMSGLDVRAVHSVNVVGPNRPDPARPRPHPAADMAGLIIGDHLEAIAAIVAARGPRGGLPDLGRRRDLLIGSGAARQD